MKLFKAISYKNIVYARVSCVNCLYILKLSSGLNLPIKAITLIKKNQVSFFLFLRENTRFRKR